MKKLFLLLFLSFWTVSLSACESQKKEMTLLDNISTISISKSNGYGGLNENYFISIKKDELTSKFEEVLKDTKGIKQNVDLTNDKPEYDILIRYENGETHGLHLVLGNEGEESTFIYIGNEKNGYIVSAEKTNILRKMLDE
ncbi:hypothetical protein FVO58_22085 [Metabacillus halosaccharovorans]|nr:hypothetical protein [Metabacillus halosaccharovorans]